MNNLNNIGYHSIYNDNRINLCLFFLKQNTYLPFHDHPFMDVFSKVIKGRMKYEFIDF